MATAPVATSKEPVASRHLAWTRQGARPAEFSQAPFGGDDRNAPSIGRTHATSSDSENGEASVTGNDVE